MAILVDTRDFERALEKALLNTSRDLPAVLNGHAIGVITKAAALTLKADPEKIRQALTRGTTTPRTQSKTGKTLKKPKVFQKPTLAVYKILNARWKKGGGAKGLNNEQMRVQAQQFIKLRIAAVGFNAWAGWQNALKAVGGRGFGRGSVQQRFTSSSAAQGSGQAATVGSLLARISNTAAWIEHIGKEPLQEALNAEAAQMMRHIEEKLSAGCKEASR